MGLRTLAFALFVLATTCWMGGSRTARAAVEVVVTSAGDSVVSGESECPHATKCTLRRAIELANGDVSGDPVTINFDPDVFDPGGGTTIAVLATPLPPVTRNGVTIDGSSAGVRLNGAALSQPADGLVLTGEEGGVRRLAVHGFGGVCIALGGPRGFASDILAGHCGSGIVVSGEDSIVRGNQIGFSPDGDPAPVSVGVLIVAPGARVGNAAGGPAAANTIGNAATGIRVGEAPGPEFDDVEIAGNILGNTPSGGVAAPLGTGVEVRPPASRVQIVGNAIANTSGSGVVIAADSGGASSQGNRISLNRFEAIGALSIDLEGNGERETNDAGDADSGPNELLNHPVITRAIQSRIEGTACASCRVEMYLAHHTPGSENDFGTNPIPDGVLTASGGGLFEWNAPPVTPGQWVVALAIDDAGNASEFSSSTRVGAGVAQCGNVGLASGWNLVGYFGQASLPLGNSFPPDVGTASKVSAIYRLQDGSANYQAWFENGGVGRTLNMLEAGEAYWMHAMQPAAISGGFSLTVPLPVSLKVGWNEFLYIGATVDPRDALASIRGKYTAVYEWEKVSHPGRWRTFDPDLPAWAQGIPAIESCGAYSIFVTEDVTLTPPQP